MKKINKIIFEVITIIVGVVNLLISLKNNQII